ncbi:lantibiotic dehydratase [Mucilaginibacter pedocola]|uniref:Lantibiotic dehydratase n=1 Tax=Mucilaginibacter pedocola TaxID=1792845 RepID=A0A1S9PGA5_9SPHI|nr:lantibiotic dehydratase [Mucilaginibacter pedocola]OOQ59991.1 hypothetical protein BC343_27050 [Mucilaginibacter pedocola]
MDYKFREELFLRAPAYSFAAYDPGRLPEVLLDKAFQDAVYLASPGFYRVLETKAFEHGKLNGKERHTALKYYNRMSFRPVPYGSFASFTNLKWDKSGTTQLKAGRSKGKLHLLPDMEFLQATGAEASGKLALNPLLYRVGGQYRYIRSIPRGTKTYEFVLGAIDAEPYYEGLFKFLNGRLAGIEELIAYTRGITGCGEEEAGGQLEFMISEQILLLPQQRSPIGQAAGHRVAKGSVVKLARKYCPQVGEAIPRFYTALERPLLSGGPAFAVQDALGNAMVLLQKLSAPLVPAALQEFTKAFEGHFGLQQVPLLEALDPDTGIAYGGLAGVGLAGGLDGLPFPVAETPGASLHWTHVHRYLFARWQQDAGRDKYAPVQLDADDTALPAGAALLPPSTSIVFRETEEYILLEQAGGATATAMAGRFSPFSDTTRRLCRSIAAQEQAANPGIVFADIGQLSALHTDNINRRRPIYPYEIPLNVQSSMPGSRQLLPGGLYLSVRNGELLLFSKKLDKRVMPRLATAYNHRNTQLSVFRFLCDLQYQGTQAALAFDPEQYFPGLSFYPRFYTGRVILSLAKWHFTPAELRPLLNAGSEEALRCFRREYGLPQRVLLGGGDQQLAFDLAHAPEASFFLECLKGQGQVTLQEYLLPGRSVKCGYEPFAGQFLAFLHNGRASYRPMPGHVPQSGMPRAFPPGSTWLYLKLYCTPVSAERLLTEVFRPVLSAQSARLANWHFVRFTDSGHHIRLRVKVKAGSNVSFIESLQKAIREAGLEHLVQEFRADTYRPELERYHPKLMELAEDVFRESSGLAISFIGMGDTQRFHFALASAHAMIVAFLENDGAAFCEIMAESFLQEHRADKALKIALGNKFRGLRNLLGGTPVKEPAFHGLIETMSNIRDAATSLGAQAKQELLGSLVHMHLNRCFPAEQRKQELLVYYSLSKYLRSLTKRLQP